MSYSEEKFIAAIAKSFETYKLKGARSPEKIKPLHSYVAQVLSAIWGEMFETNFMGENSKEKRLDGKYYPKNIDITVSRNQKPVFCVGVKFVTSNYKQNANNYFESMMGETANIQTTVIPYAHLIIFRYETPYYKKNETQKPKKLERVNEKDLTKYLKLAMDAKQAHRPEALGIMLVDIDEKTRQVNPTQMRQKFSKEFVEAFERYLSVPAFVDAIEKYKTGFMATNK